MIAGAQWCATGTKEMADMTKSIGALIARQCVGALLLIFAVVGGAASAKDTAAASAPEVIRLWPGDPPGGTLAKTPERTFSEQADRKWQKVTISVSEPTMTVVRPAPGKANGTAMIVAPGGGFVALVWDLEGTEIAEWLAARGVTAFVLKYRVSLPSVEEVAATDMAVRLALMEPRRKLAVADAAQAIKLVRQDAARWGIDPKRVGMMGFSAGAMTTMGVVMSEDAAERPNFAAPIYGAAPLDKATVPFDAPPIFIAHAQNDSLVPATSGTAMFDAWLKAKRPAELHIYTEGGHGFGMRVQGLPVDRWPTDFEAWLAALDLIAPNKSAKKQTSPKAPASLIGRKGVPSIKTTSIGELLKNSAAKAIVDRNIPGLMDSPVLGASRSLTLTEVQAYASALITDERLTAIETEFRKLRPQP